MDKTNTLRFDAGLYERIKQYAQARGTSINRAVNELAAMGLDAQKGVVGKMEKIRVPRTGERPLVFQGEKLLATENRWQNGREQTHWTTMDIYRTMRGKYVAHIRHNTLWQGESDHDYAVVAETPEELEADLKDRLPADLFGELVDLFDLAEEVE